MKLSELVKLENCPEWLKRSSVKVFNENVELDSNNTVIWKSGTWESGGWESGNWESGNWESGVWHDGTWESGYFESGKFINGKIIAGYFTIPQISKWAITLNMPNGNIKIGCKEKQIADWDKFFYNSNKVYETKRDTSEFKRICKAYEIAKLTLELFKY